MAETLVDVAGQVVGTVETDPAHVNPMPGQVLMRVKEFGADYEIEEGETRERVDSIDDANVITSECVQRLFTLAPRTDLHKPILDIDLPAKLIPSSTEGHYHLYIDHEVAWLDYLDLLKALAKCGIIEEGYVFAAERRGHTAVRLPWIRKEETP